MNIWLPKESLQLKFTAKYRLFMVMTVMWALCITGPKHVRMAPGIVDLCDKQWSGWPVTELMSFTRKRLMNWLRTINISLIEKLLSSLAFCKNVWITLFMSFNIRRCKYDGFLTCWWYRRKLQELKYASNSCHTMRMKMRNFFKILWQLTNRGCIIMNMKPSISLLQRFTCKKENTKPTLGHRKSWIEFLGCRWFIQTDCLEDGTTIKQSGTMQHLKLWNNYEELGSTKRTCCSLITLGHTPRKPPWRQLISWISPSYHTHHTAQTWCHGTSTVFHKWIKTFVHICITQMKMWKGLSGPGWRNKVWHSSMTALTN